MKTLLFLTLFLINGIFLEAQTEKTATLKSSSRLFATKNDLTSVITLIPSGSVVSVLDSDSTYFHVTFDENEGYIFKRQAVIDKTPRKIVKNTPPEPQAQAAPEPQPQQNQANDRYSYLENKYGSTMADRLYAGKIWKGMNAEMVSDSWGTADKINRVIESNIIKEEWIFKTTWLYFENNTLVDWGPVKK